jgi:drug/metabolite transporter (DMT)-like permease
MLNNKTALAHNEHNRPRKSGGFFLIILGALIFILSPITFGESPQVGMGFIVLGFIVGGIGFYLNFIKKRR